MTDLPLFLQHQFFRPVNKYIFISSSAAKAQGTPRQRIAYRGCVMPGAYATPKWAAAKPTSVPATTAGDLFVVETNVHANETQTIAIYARALPIKEGKDGWVADGDAFLVPASNRGKEWGYSPSAASSASTFAEVKNTSGQPSNRQILLFLPFEAMKLPEGKNYEIYYEIVVFVDKVARDQFEISKRFQRTATLSDAHFRGSIRVYSVKNHIIEFTLIGAKDDSPST